MKNLHCLNDIIYDNLAVNIDLTQFDSWNLNTGLTVSSLTKWSKAISDNINLIDYGLTEFDNGATNVIYSGITISPSDLYFKMNRVGYNYVINPTTGQTSGSTVITKYDLYPITATTSNVGNYFNLNGGYLQGFFGLYNYNYKLLPYRFNRGISIETLLYIQPNSQGIFFMMGIRAEDKYNQYFSGETMTGYTTITNIPYFSGVTTSENNTFDSYNETEITKKAFSKFEDNQEILYTIPPIINNIKGNVIAFELTSDKKLAYRYVDDNGNLIMNVSQLVLPSSGWALISIVFTPDEIIKDLDLLSCYKRRTGKLILYVNGRAIWIIKDFPEFYFRNILNNRNLQIGVPYSISWGGGSFGLKNSWHYDYQTYSLYTNQNNTYINNKFIIESDPLPPPCSPYSGGTILSGISLTLDNTTFHTVDVCDSTIRYPENVLKITYSGSTENTNNSKYFIKFNQKIEALSNREYTINLNMFNAGFFDAYIENNFNNKISIIVYGSTDVNIINEIVYYFPISITELINLSDIGLFPFPDKQEYEYELNGRLYYGATGVPVRYNDLSTYINLTNNAYVTGEMEWIPLMCKFKTSNNSGKQQLYVGILIESDYGINKNTPIFIKDFKYTAQDILVQDTNRPTFIEENFDNSFIGGIQKLRIYDCALTSPEILHNALMEAKNGSINVQNGGRLMTPTTPTPTSYIFQYTAGSDIRKSIKYKNADNTYKNLFNIIDIMVIIKSRTNPNTILIKYDKISGSTSGTTGWYNLIYVDDYTYDFIIPNTITMVHPNEILFAEIKFQWVDPNDFDNINDVIIITDVTTALIDNTIKNLSLIYQNLQWTDGSMYNNTLLYNNLIWNNQ
jgi:hypothetical protein